MTPFEELLFYDSKRECTPADAITILNFTGRFDRQKFEASVHAAALRTFTANRTAFRQKNGVLSWNSETVPLGIHYFKGPQAPENRPEREISIQNESGIHFWIYDTPEKNQTEIWFQFHHLTTDALGSFLFLNEIFDLYSGRTLPEREVLSESEIRMRSKPVLDLHLKFIALKQIAAYFFRNMNPFRRKMLHLCGKQADGTSKIPSLMRTSEEKKRFQVLFETFTVTETLNLRRFARKNAISMNDVMLTALSEAVFQFHVKHETKIARIFRRAVFSPLSRVFCPSEIQIAVPVNMRNKRFENLTLGNVVSTVFLSLPFHLFSGFSSPSTPSTPPLRLFQTVHRKMERNRENRCAELLLQELTWLCSVHFRGNRRWGMEKFSRRRKPLATFLLSNLGILFQASTLPRTEEEKLCVGELVLDAVQLASPRTTNAAVAVALGTYAGRLHFGMNYNADVLTDADAMEIRDLWKEILHKIICENLEAKKKGEIG